MPTNPKVKIDVGTKDAPVDGLDGKPHAGPWVEAGTEKDKKKSEDEADQTVLISSGKKPGPKPLADTKPVINDAAIPEVNDGVMDDPNRASPKKGTTGTEGGVSEKDRDRKAQEGQTGEKTEKKPDPPKEARPLPHSEEKKIKQKEGDKSDTTKEADSDKEIDLKDGDVEKSKELGGLAVSFARARHLARMLTPMTETYGPAREATRHHPSASTHIQRRIQGDRQGRRL